MARRRDVSRPWPGGAVLCATDLDDLPEPPTIRRTGRFLYLRLRRTGYDEAGLAAWAARLEPFLAAGDDAFVFFRHDADGESALRASCAGGALLPGGLRRPAI